MAERIERVTKFARERRADLYVYFVLIAHEWLAEDGIAAWLLPTEFLHANYGQVFRNYLATQVELIRLHTYDLTAPRFENARVSSAFVLFRKRSPRVGHRALMTTGGSLANPVGSALLDVESLGGVTSGTRPYLDSVRWPGLNSPGGPSYR